jgi:WhiB family redox-sensing transcriptional regulator
MTNPAVAGNWWELAACQAADPELFFPVSAAGPAVSQSAKAKAVCASCAVRLRCLEFALSTRQPHGVWGGMDEQERRAFRAGQQASLISRAG